MKSTDLEHWIIECPIRRRRRERNNISQQRLADESGISYDTLNQIERGNRHNPGMHTVGAIAGALGISGAKLHYELAMWMNDRPKEGNNNGASDSGS